MKKLGLADAVFIGLAAMLGAGVFVVYGPAFSLAGPYLLVSIILAGIVAYLNAASIAQLAARVTRSGGAYAYGRHYLSDTWGFVAGVSFLVGKIGSAAAIALTFASYVLPEAEIPVAVSAVLVMAGINIAGINRTAFGSKILAIITVGFLGLLIVASWFAPAAEISWTTPDPTGILGAAALFFFAFAGYARVATLGGEVSDSARNVPKAIRISLGLVLIIFLALAFALLTRLGDSLGGVTPLADLAVVALPAGVGRFVFIFAAIASLGSLLALLAGMSRTASEMAHDGELPRIFASKIKNGAPVAAELTISLLAILLVLSGSVVFTIGISSFAVLTYYAVANLAALRQPVAETSRPKALNISGLALCLILAFSVPPMSLILGGAVIVTLLLLRWGLKALS